MDYVGSPVSQLSTTALTFCENHTEDASSGMHFKVDIVVCATSWPSAADIQFFCSVCVCGANQLTKNYVEEEL